MHDTQAHDKATTANNWKTPGTSVSGRHNTPPQQDDLVPRSRVTTERNGRGREKVKLSCFFDKRVKPKNLERLNKMNERKTIKMNKVENTPLEKRNMGYDENQEV